MSAFEIMIIDDDEDQHEILGQYLDLAGYKVKHATDGAAGLDLLEREGADLVLLDVRMPGMDGFEALKRKQATPGIRDIPVLLLTSLDKPHLKVKGLELGAEDYLTKPCNKAELLARVRAALRRTARYKRNLAAVEGDLTDLPLTELLQPLELTGRQARVRLQELGGEVLLGEGGSLWASFGDRTGREALERLILLGRGLFSVLFDEQGGAPPSDQEPLPLRGALMGALTRMDEVLATLEGVAGLEDPVELAAHASLTPDLEDLRALGPVPMGLLLARIPGDLGEAANMLAQMRDNGTLRVLS